MAIKKLSRRDFVRWSALGGGTSLLAATGATAAAQGDPVTLTIWAQDWGKLYNDPMIALSDAFTRDVAPNVQVEWTFMPDISQKLIAAIAAGNPPDIAMTEQELANLAAAGGLAPLDSYFAQDGVRQEDFIPFTWETVLYEGVPYGIPGGAGAVCLAYDKAVFKEVGIDPEAVPDTPSWDQFVEWNERLVKRDEGGEIVRVGFVPEASVFQQFAGILGATYFNDDRTQLTVNSPETVEAVERWVGLLPEDYSYEQANNLMSSASTDPQGGLGSGVVGLEIPGYWAFEAFDEYWPELDYGITKLPTPNGTKEEWSLYTGWAWNMSIPQGAEHPDEAWAFLKYGFWEHGAMLADTLNWTCVLDEFPEFLDRTGKLMGPDNRMQPYLHHFAEAQVEAQYFIPYTLIEQQLEDAMTQAIDQVLRGERSAQEALDEAVAQLQPDLDKAVAG